MSDEAIFKEYDVDGNGTITVDEFDEIMEETFVKYIERLQFMDEFSEKVSMEGRYLIHGVAVISQRNFFFLNVEVFKEKIVSRPDLKDFFTVFATDPATNYVGAAMASIGMTQLGVVPDHQGQSDNLTGSEESAQNEVDHKNVSA